MAGRRYASPPYNKNESRSLAGAAFVLYWGWSGSVPFCLRSGRRWAMLLGLPGVREYRYPSRYRLDFLKTANGWKVVRIATL